MEEVKKFIQLLWKYRLIIIAVPLITVMITYFIVRKMPSVYGAPTQIATGIVDETQQMAFSDASDLLQESRITQKFINLIETMRSKNLLDLVSYRLILHDLKGQPFKPYSKVLKDVSMDKGALDHAIAVYTEKYKKKEGLNLRDPDQNGLDQVIQSMGYGSGSLLDGLSVYRIGASDFIFVDFESENAELSAFVVNTLVEEFITDYTRLVKQNQRSSVEFLEKLIQIKADTLAQRVTALRNYKIKNRILNLNEQSSQLLNELATYEAQKQDAEKNILALNGTIANIDKKFDPADRRYAEAATTGINQQLLITRDQIQALYKKYQDSDFDEKYKTSIDSLERIATEQISNLNDKYSTNPLNTKDALIQSRLPLEIQHDMAVFSLNSIKKRIDDINKTFGSLVPHEAAIQTMDRDINIVTKEYQDLLAQYNQISMESEFPVKLRQIQIAMPGGAKPSKKMLLVILSGIISGVFCIIVFFVIFFFDNKIRRPAELAIATRMPVLGYLNLVGKSTIDLKGIWKNLHGTPEMMEFKKQLRSTRFEVNRELPRLLNKAPVLGITSLSPGEGKTLIAACIAYTYVMINKKVLLIDGNFDNPSITKNSNTKIFIEDYFETGDLDTAESNPGIMVMGNRGGDKSLLEVCDEHLIHERINRLKEQFDIILIETPSLESLNKAKEWVQFTDSTVSIFEANQSLSERKQQHIQYLSSINGQFIGWILNKVQSEGTMPEHIDAATVID